MIFGQQWTQPNLSDLHYHHSKAPPSSGPPLALERVHSLPFAAPHHPGHASPTHRLRHLLVFIVIIVLYSDYSVHSIVS